jgi:hypothetical protein
MSVLPEVLKANEAYAANFGAKSQLALPPARRFAILTLHGRASRSGKIRRAFRTP